MIPTPIHRALATLRESEVPTLLIGGQACIVAEAALGVNDTALRRARELLDHLDRKIPAGGRRYPAAPSRTRSEPK